MDPSAKHPQKKHPEKSKECAECVKLHAEIAKLRDMAGRAQADLQNAKDRLQREGEDMRKYALENTLLALLPTVENFQRAFAHLPEDLKNHDWVKGVSAVEQELMRHLSGLGLAKMECVGEQADPHKHEVLQAGPGEKEKIVEVFEDGYTLNGKVLKPAKVRVGDGIEAQSTPQG